MTSLRMLARDWRAGELRVLAAALVLAVASVTTVGFFADRVSQALLRDAHQLMGADLVLLSDHPWTGKVVDVVGGSGASTAEAINFISMALRGERSQLAGVKAVSENYPLRGRLRTAAALGAPDAPAQRGPAPGTVWVEERLVGGLDAPVGSMLRLGQAQLRVAAILTLEPERNANFFNIAPRLMMNVADVPATGLVQTGSRVSYYLYAAGDAQRMAELEAAVRPILGRGERLDTLESGRPEIRAAIERAQRFLSLTALLAAVLAGVAIALGTRRFVERHLDGCAVMRCLGATQSRLLALHAGEFALLGVLACAVGAFIGYGAQSAIGAALTDLIRADLPSPTPWPALQGFLVGLVLLLGFALPPLMQLKDVPALRVIRREAGALKRGALGAYGVGMTLLAALLVWQAGDLKLGAYVVGGFAVAVLVFFAIAWAALTALSRVKARSRSVRYGLANLRRHARGNAVQVASLALGLTAVLLLTFTRNDLVDAWRRAAPADAPNRFLLGVQRDQLDAVKNYLASNGLGEPQLYPMVRGRVVSVNARAVNEADYSEERARRLVEREFNLSFAQALPAHNALAGGRWTSDGLSVEEGIAQRLGWKLGDELEFAIGGETFRAPITSFRRLRWDSMKVNFFVIAPPQVLDRFPTSYISAFRVAPGREVALNRLAVEFPNLTLVDVGAALKQAQDVVDQLIAAVQFIFLFTLGAGLLVLYSALVATEDERRREAAVMRVYGASRAQVAGAQRIEFLAMGLTAGILATFGAALIGQLLARRVFELDLPPSAALLVAGPLAGIALLSLNAWLSSRKVLRASPALTLRESV
ncbi:MAG TPA: FtsX-like permease family protein [Burkholderiales bacterium]|nr:FtsX-like permease family protein [Burkholderiales bacterium]